jgi:hypothetical protein
LPSEFTLSPVTLLIRVNPKYPTVHAALQHQFSSTAMVAIVVAMGWLYVALMMAVAEANNSNGTLLGALVTFVLYGALPVALVVYVLMTPARKKAIRAREAATWAAQQAEQKAAAPQPSVLQPDGGGETPADPVAPVRKEP